MTRLKKCVNELQIENASLRRERDAQNFRERQRAATDRLKLSPKP